MSLSFGNVKFMFENIIPPSNRVFSRRQSKQPPTNLNSHLTTENIICVQQLAGITLQLLYFINCTTLTENCSRTINTEIKYWNTRRIKMAGECVWVYMASLRHFVPLLFEAPNDEENGGFRQVLGKWLSTIVFWRQSPNQTCSYKPYVLWQVNSQYVLIVTSHSIPKLPSDMGTLASTSNNRH